MGYAPFVIKKNSTKRYLKYRKLQSIIVGLLQLSTISNLCIVSHNSLANIKFKSFLVDATRSLSLITPSVSVIIQIIMRRVYAREFIAIFNELYDIDQKLKVEFEIKLAYKKLGVVSMLPLLIGLLDLVFVNPTAYTANNSYIAAFSESIFYAYLLLSLIVIVVEFFTIILIFRNIFAGIRQFLIREFLDKSTAATHPEILQNLSSIHQDLCSLLRRYNRTISFQILMVFAYIYLTSCLCIFTLILSISRSEFLLFPNSIRCLPILVCTLILIKLGYSTMISSSCRDEVIYFDDISLLFYFYLFFFILDIFVGKYFE